MPTAKRFATDLSHFESSTWWIRPAVALLLFGMAAAPVHASRMEDAINARLKGAWVLTRLDLMSECDANYSNNRILGTDSLGTGRHRLGAGELGRVYKVDIKRNRVDLLIDLDETLLVPFTDGPFQLYDDAHCKVELFIDAPREVLKGKTVLPLEKLLLGHVERFSSPEEAKASPNWNRRRRAPLPPGYEETLAQYDAWKAAQVNVAARQRIEEASREIARLLDRVREDPNYAEGFAAGIRAARYSTIPTCDRLLGSYPSYFAKSPDKDGLYNEGHKDGQTLTYFTKLIRGLSECFDTTAL